MAQPNPTSVAQFGQSPFETPPQYAYAAINTAATTTVKSGAGVVHAINIVGGTLGAVTVYDNTTGSGTTIIPTWTPAAAQQIILDAVFGTGLTIVTAAATVINVEYL